MITRFVTRKGKFKISRSTTSNYLANVMVTVAEAGVAALADTLTLNVNALVAPAATDVADGKVTLTSKEEEVTVGDTVSASWPELATVIAIAPKSPAKTLPLHEALRESVEIVHVTASKAKSPLTPAALMDSGSLTLSVVDTDRALKA
jgi:hypothetical protein